VAPRSTVQADALAKEDLSGTWYFRQTVVGVPFQAGFTFVGEQGDGELEKIRWDIQEEFLVARRAYETVRGTESGSPEGERNAAGEYLGTPVAAFKVKSHFDIVREYNPSTGEEYDKVVESQERKWFDRRFLRVDWSQNLVGSFQFLADWSGDGVQTLRQEPTPYYVSDPKDPDAFRVERPSEDAPADYLEVTQKIAASPEMVTFEDGSRWPICFLEYATADCSAHEIRVRNSFLRATPREYEPRAYSDKDMERFGFFTTERKSYNRQYGLTESGRVRLLNRHDIWRRSMSDTVCVQDTDCGPSQAGVRCVREHPAAPFDAPSGVQSGLCSLPYPVRNLEDPGNPQSRDLGPRVIAYHLTEKFPEDLKGAALEVGRQYDELFRSLYRGATGREAPGPLFVVCSNNPVVSGDPAACGPVGTRVRIGDIRYNLLAWVDMPTSAELLGYGPTSNDPETGETISGTAFVYGASIDTYAAWGRDLVRLVNGELSLPDAAAGVDVATWVMTRPWGTRRQPLSQADVDAAADAMDTSWMSGLPRTPGLQKGNVSSLRAMRGERVSVLSQSPLMRGSRGSTARRLDALEKSALLPGLVNDEVWLAQGRDPRSPLGGNALEALRPLQHLSPERARLVRQKRAQLGAHGVDLAVSLDDSVLGFALAQKGVDPNVVWKRIREQVFLSTALHEVGHSLGLRHNFAGSYDPMNYPRTYWDLRTFNGTKQPRPRYLDPESQAEREGVALSGGLRAGISEFMQSSIMDYGAGFNSDIHGLGKYDRAAIEFAYGDIVEVFTDVKDAYLLGALQASATYGATLPLLVSCDGNDYVSVHYTKLPQVVNLEAREKVWRGQVERRVLRPDCAYPDTVEVDAARRPVVPYQFCSDEFDGATPSCASFDRGADVYEVAQATMDRYRGHYVLEAFKRDRLGFNPEGHMERLYSRYFDPLRSLMQSYALERSTLADALPDDGPNSFWRSADGYGPWTVATTDTFNFFGEVLMTPEPGPYQRYAGADWREAWYMDPYAVDAPAFTLPLGVGRHFATEWEFDSGYHWYERIRVVGSFLDKVAAIAELTDPETYFVGKDVSSDVRQFAINYSRLYPRQVTDTFAALLTDRWDRVAPTWDGSKLVHRPISGTITIPAGGVAPVDPQVGFTVQLYLASLGQALVPGGWDGSFADSSRVWLDGSDGALTSTLPTVSYQDPYSGKTYVAVSYKSGILETGIGARMISRANELKGFLDPADPSTATALKSYVQLLEAQRSLTELYKNPAY
jgi:hypothetical protein